MPRAVLHKHVLRTILAGIVGGILLSSCSSTESPASPSNSPSGSQTSASQTSGSPTSGSPTGGSQTGEATEPVSDLRVVDLSDSIFDLATLGVPAVGNIYGPEYVTQALADIPNIDPAVSEALLEAPNIAPGFQVDLEKVAALKPDVILLTEGFQAFFTDIMPRLEAIADVVVVTDDGTWQGHTVALAAALDLDAASAQERVEEVEQQLVEVTDSVTKADLPGTSVSLLRAFGTEENYAYLPPSLASTIIEQVGLEQPEGQLALTADAVFPPSAAQAAVSPETLGSQEGNIVLYGTSQPGDLDRFLAQPVVKAWPAAKDDEIHSVPYFLWALNSAVGVEQMLEDIEEFVAN